MEGRLGCFYSPFFKGASTTFTVLLPLPWTHPRPRPPGADRQLPAPPPCPFPPFFTTSRCFKEGADKNLPPFEYVEGLKKQGIRVPGIGHRIKSKDNRDKRVELLQEYSRKVCVFV